MTRFPNRGSATAVSCCVLLLACGLTTLASAQVTVGEHVPISLGTLPYDYPAETKSSLGDTELWSDVIVHPGATYIAPHFARLDLPLGDVLVIRSVDGSQRWEYVLRGRNDAGVSEEGFFATHIKGDTAVIELVRRADVRSLLEKAGPDRNWGFEIDRYGRGYDSAELAAYWAAGLGEEMNLARPDSMTTKALCGADDSREAKCYQSSEWNAYNESKAVARLLKNGSVHCTGWLIGAAGHIMTNEHCIGSQSELNSIDFEFMAEGSSCATNCKSAGACPGTIEASGGSLVAVDANLDYAMVDPSGSGNFALTYGYLQARSTGANLGERIYIPQHPAGWGKRIALASSHSSDGGAARVYSLTRPRCGGSGYDVGYYADTQGGSSGSPVLGYDDNKVIALHHCAYCPNRGVPIQHVLTDLGTAVPLGGSDAKPYIGPSVHITRSGSWATAVTAYGVGPYTYKWWRKPKCSGGGGGPWEPVVAPGSDGTDMAIANDDPEGRAEKDVNCTAWYGPFDTSPSNQWQPYQITNQNLKVTVCDVWGSCTTAYSYLGGGDPDF